MKKRRRWPRDFVDGPAVITDDYVRDRAIDAMKTKAWSRLAGYEKAYNKGHLLCKERCTSAAARDEEQARAHDRFTAARNFDLSWHRCQKPFPGGSDFDRVRSGGGGTPGGFADHARDAKTFWRKVQDEMGANDWMICRMVCCEGYAVSEAVMTVSPSYKCTTNARFREALDGLIEGIKLARITLRSPMAD